MERTLLLIASLLLTFPAAAQEMPTREELGERLGAYLPSYWKLNDFRLIASTQQGDPISPKALVRFEADVVAASDLFTPTGQKVGPFSLIVGTLDGGTPRTLYGTMTLSYGSGKWNGDPVIENPITDLGQPVDVFSTPTLPLGSERQMQIVSDMKASALREAIAKFDSELAKIQTENEKKLAEARAALAAEQKELQNSFQPRIAAEKVKLDEKIASLRDAHATQIEEMKTVQARKVDELKARNLEEISEIESAFDTRIKELKMQIANSEKIASLHQELKEKIEITKKKQRELFASLGKVLRGNVDCVTNRSGWPDTGGPLRLVANEVTGSGISGTAEYTGKNGQHTHPFVLVLTDSSNKIPLKMGLSIDFQQLPKNYFVELGITGTITGTAKTPSDRCKVVLGSP